MAKKVKKKKNFVQKMVADGTTDTVSSKRITMLLAMMMLIGLAIASACGYSCDSSYVYIFGGLVGAQSGLTSIEKCARGINQAKIEVAKAEYAEKQKYMEEDEDFSDEDDEE